MNPAVPKSVLVLAAGLGLRMRPLTDHIPKPLLEVGGQTLLDRAINQAKAVNPQCIVINAHYLADQIEAHLQQRNDLTLSISHELELLETGGAVKAALPRLGAGPIFVLNSDALWVDCTPLCVLADAWAKRPTGALLLLVAADRARAHRGAGDFVLGPDDRLYRFTDSNPHDHGEAYIYTGAQILGSGALGDLPDGRWSLNLLWDKLLQAGDLRGTVMTSGTWIDVGTPDGIAVANRYCNDGAA